MHTRSTLEMPPAAVIFDMDGTLLDTERLAVECWVEAFEGLGIEMSVSVITSTVACDPQRKRQIFIDNLPPDLVVGLDPDLVLDAWKKILVQRMRSEGISVKPGARETMGMLRDLGIPIGVATSTPSLLAKPFLQSAGLLQWVDVMVCGEDVVDTKPSPEIYLEAARRLAVEPSEIWAVEDSIQGIQAAVAAGMATIHIPDLQTVPPEVRAKAWKVFTVMTELADLIDDVSRRQAA